MSLCLGMSTDGRVLRPDTSVPELPHSCAPWAGHFLHLPGPQFPHLCNQSMCHNRCGPSQLFHSMTRSWALSVWCKAMTEGRGENYNWGMALWEREDLYLFLPLKFLWFSLISSSWKPVLVFLCLSHHCGYKCSQSPLAPLTLLPLWWAWPSCQMPSPRTSFRDTRPPCLRLSLSAPTPGALFFFFFYFILG